MKFSKLNERPGNLHLAVLIAGTLICMGLWACQPEQGQDHAGDKHDSHANHESHEEDHESHEEDHESHEEDHESHEEDHDSHEENHDAHEEDHGHHDHGHTEHVGRGLAVLSADEKLGVEFNPLALNRIKARFVPPTTLQQDGNRLRLPAVAVIRSRDQNMIYALVQSRVVPVMVRPIQHSGSDMIIQIQDEHFAPGDLQSIAIAQVDIIHLGYLEAFGASGAGHGH